MSEEANTFEKLPEELEVAVQAIIKKTEEMTPEEHVAKFKKIGFLTETGEVAPEFQGVDQLLMATAG